MTEQLNEARQVHASTHKLIETLGGGGIPERVCVVAMQQALLERLVASGGVDGYRIRRTVLVIGDRRFSTQHGNIDFRATIWQRLPVFTGGRLGDTLPRFPARGWDDQRHNRTFRGGSLRLRSVKLGRFCVLPHVGIVRAWLSHLPMRSLKSQD